MAHRVRICIGIVAALVFLWIGYYQPDTGVLDQNFLRRGLNGDPESLNPHYFSSNQSASVLRDIGEGLLRYDSAGILVEGVAEKWSISEDGLLYEFKLRNDARWSNGDPVLARDFVSAFRALVTPDLAARNADNAEHILNASSILRGELPPTALGVYADDPKVLKIQLSTQTPYFIQLLAHPSMFPIHEVEILAKSENGFGDIGITNGAYSLAKRVIGSEIILERNPIYWNNAETYFDRVTYHILQESAEFVRFRAGEIDITENVTSSSFELAKREYPNELRIAPLLGVYYYGFNLTNSIFQGEPNLRRALSLAIDRKMLVSKVTGRGEQEAYGWVPPGFHGYESQSIAESEMGDRKSVV